MRSNQATFLSRSRRAQLIAAAIEVVAERGYANTALSDIAAHAGTSKGVLLYHFADKDDLIKAAVAEIFAVSRSEVGPRVEAAEGGRAKLSAYIRARVGFLATHRAHMQALLDIWISHRDAAGRPYLDDRAAEPALAVVEDLLRLGQAGGEFRRFPTRPMAVSIMQAIDGVLLQLLAHPDLDLDVYAREISMTFDLATRRTP